MCWISVFTFFSGMGFIGRNVLAFLVENDLASFVRVVDKQVPSTVYLGPRFQAALSSPKVWECLHFIAFSVYSCILSFNRMIKANFLQANLAKEAGVKNAFTHADGEFDFVNLPCMKII